MSSRLISKTIVLIQPFERISKGYLSTDSLVVGQHIHSLE